MVSTAAHVSTSPLTKRWLCVLLNIRFLDKKLGLSRFPVLTIFRVLSRQKLSIIYKRWDYIFCAEKENYIKSKSQWNLTWASGMSAVQSLCEHVHTNPSECQHVAIMPNQIFFVYGLHSWFESSRETQKCLSIRQHVSYCKDWFLDGEENINKTPKFCATKELKIPQQHSC